MKTLALLSLLAIAAAPMPVQRRDDQAAAFEQRRAGRLLPLPEIERRVIPTMKGARYLGMDFDAERSTYTLKFLRDGTVIWVQVDGRTGQVLGRTGG